MELNKVYQMDCLEGLRQLPDGSVDMVNTDPPYNLGKAYDEYDDNRPEEEYWVWYGEVFKELYRVMREGYLYVTCGPDQIFKAKPLIESCGFVYVEWMVWYGPNLGTTTRVTKPWSYLHEPILMFRKGEKRIKMLNDTWGISSGSVLVHTRPQTNFPKNKRVHVCQRPVSLYEQLIARTPGQIVLDPFMGSGTTALACRKLGRKFIGFEISKGYCALIEQRLRQISPQRKLEICE